jgi:hypothetical protein
VSNLYISTIGTPILLQPNRRSDHGNMQIAHRYMNVGFGNKSAQIHFWNYLFPIFGSVSLQCSLILVKFSKWMFLACFIHSMTKNKVYRIIAFWNKKVFLNDFETWMFAAV